MPLYYGNEKIDLAQPSFLRVQEKSLKDVVRRIVSHRNDQIIINKETN